MLEGKEAQMAEIHCIRSPSPTGPVHSSVWYYGDDMIKRQRKAICTALCLNSNSFCAPETDEQERHPGKC